MVSILSATTRQRKPTNSVTNREATANAKPLPHDTRAGIGNFARPIGAFVPKVTARVFERYGFHSAEIMTSWSMIVGSEIARLARPESIKWPRGTKLRGDAAEDRLKAGGATLIIACAPAFALDISYRTQEIIDRINRYFGYRAIAQLTVHQVPECAEVQRISPPATAWMTAPNRIGDLASALDALGKRIADAKPG